MVPSSSFSVSLSPLSPCFLLPSASLTNPNTRQYRYSAQPSLICPICPLCLHSVCTRPRCPSLPIASSPTSHNLPSASYFDPLSLFFLYPYPPSHFHRRSIKDFKGLPSPPSLASLLFSPLNSISLPYCRHTSTPGLAPVTFTTLPTDPSENKQAIKQAKQTIDQSIKRSISSGNSFNIVQTVIIEKRAFDHVFLNHPRNHQRYPRTCY